MLTADFPGARRVASLTWAVGLALAAPAASQSSDEAAGRENGACPGLATPSVLPGSPAADRFRLGEVRGTHGNGSSLRSLSACLLAVPAHGPLALGPETRVAWNPQIPAAAQGDAGLWAGRGFGARLRGGVTTRHGPLLLVLAPELHYAQNRPFDHEMPDTFPQMFEDFTLPWQTGRHRIDQPYRPGADPLLTLLPGQSTLALMAGGAAFGASTEQHWWGPGTRNALVVSDNAPGFPHLFIRTLAPARVGPVTVDAVALLGGLRASVPYRATHGGSAGRRSLSAAALAISPVAAPGFTVGVARGVYADVAGWGELPGRAADVFIRRGFAGDTLADVEAEQITSLFLRWVMPVEGAELYGEWARSELPSSLRDLALMPEHGQGYTFGGALARDVRTGVLRIAAELSYLEQSSTYRLRPVNSFYASRFVTAGYTHDGRVLGAAIGPSGSSQWLAVDWIGDGTRGVELGVFGGRVRWNNDAYNDWPGDSPARYQGHEVSLFGGVRAARDMGGWRAGGQWAFGQRYNFMFQNWAKGWATTRNSVNVPYHSLRLELSPAHRR
jgi:hypothetical protein